MAEEDLVTRTIEGGLPSLLVTDTIPVHVYTDLERQVGIRHRTIRHLDGNPLKIIERDTDPTHPMVRRR